MNESPASRFKNDWNETKEKVLDHHLIDNAHGPHRLSHLLNIIQDYLIDKLLSGTGYGGIGLHGYIKDEYMIYLDSQYMPINILCDSEDWDLVGVGDWKYLKGTDCGRIHPSSRSKIKHSFDMILVWIVQNFTLITFEFSGYIAGRYKSIWSAWGRVCIIGTETHINKRRVPYYLMDQANRADLVAGLGLAPEGRVKHGSRHQKKHPCDGKYRLLRNNKKMLLSNFF